MRAPFRRSPLKRPVAKRRAARRPLPCCRPARRQAYYNLLVGAILDNRISTYGLRVLLQLAMQMPRPWGKSHVISSPETQRQAGFASSISDLAAGASALPAVSRVAWAQTYPLRPVRMIVAFPAGNAPTLSHVDRTMAARTAGQPLIIENRPGAGSNIGTEVALKAHPDGYTLLMAVGTNATNATLYENLDISFARDIRADCKYRAHGKRHVGPPISPSKDGPGVYCLCQGQSGQDQHGVVRDGNAPHIAGELFKMMAGINMLHVPYRTSAFPDLLKSGQVNVFFSPIPGAIGYMRVRQSPSIGGNQCGTPRRAAGSPAVGEFVPGYEANGDEFAEVRGNENLQHRRLRWEFRPRAASRRPPAAAW